MIRQLKEDFMSFKDNCMGILLFGSRVRGERTTRSDIDVCMVKPSKGVLDRVHEKLGGRYDVKVFEDLPLYIKMEVIRRHEVVYGDELELSEYFYFFRKIWKDMERRVQGNEFKDFKERMRYRRRSLGEKRKILRETGSF